VIIYLHGFRSSPASIKASELKRTMVSRGLGMFYDCPQLPYEPAAAISLVVKRIRASPTPVTLVGSSLGGYYATWLAEQYGLKAVLVNPAVVAAMSLRDYIGRQENIYSGEVFEFTEAHIAQLQVLEVPSITKPSRYMLLAETGDELLDYRLAVAKYQGAQQFVYEGGNHNFTRFNDHLDSILAFAGISTPAQPRT
jgi:predicted esterase YcpF (UPF0227 family)